MELNTKLLGVGKTLTSELMEDYWLLLSFIFYYNNTFEIKGPTLTFLGKPFMIGNGLSSNIHKMRFSLV